MLNFRQFQASIEVREAGKRTVTHIQNNHPTTSEPSDNDTGNVNCSSDRSSLSCSSLKIGDMSETTETATTATNADADRLGANAANAANARQELSILHFNDVYNIDSNTTVEPIGGAARFATAIKSFAHLDPLVLFSGDAFSPSMCKSGAPSTVAVEPINH